MLQIIKSVVAISGRLGREFKILKKINLIFGQICFTEFLFCTVLLNTAMGTTFWGLSINNGHSTFNLSSKYSPNASSSYGDYLYCPNLGMGSTDITIYDLANDYRYINTFNSQGAENCADSTETLSNLSAYKSHCTQIANGRSEEHTSELQSPL